MNNGFDYNLIKFLIAIIDSRSMVRASEQLDVAPSVVSYAVTKLREHYNDPLFIRIKNGVQPTTLAMNLYEIFKPLHQSINEGIDFRISNENEGPKRRTIRIRTSTLSEYWLSYYAMNDPIISEHCTLEFIRGTADRDERINRLRKREIDLDIGLSLEGDRNIICEALFKMNLSVICRKDHPRLGSEITEEQFLKEKHFTWTSVYTYSELISGLNTLLESRHDDTLIKSESFINMLLVTMHNDAIMVIPTFFTPLITQSFSVKAVVANFIASRNSHFYAYRHKSQKSDPVISRLVEIMRGQI